MKIDKYYHLYSRKLHVVFEEIPNPVRRGWWICEDIPYTRCNRIFCSECGEDVTSTAPYVGGGVLWNYCPWCGVQMGERE